MGRYVIRRYSLGRWSWDDLAHLFAFLVLVAHGVTEHYTTEAKQPNRRHKAGKIKLSEAQQLANFQHLSRLNRLNNCFLHLCFWLVKLTFLLFYRFLFKTSSAFKKVW